MEKIESFIIPQKLQFLQDHCIGIVADNGLHEPEKVYKEQMDLIAEAEILKFYRAPEINVISGVKPINNVIWGNEIVAGSAVSRFINHRIVADDIDVYFKSIEDAKQWCKNNKLTQQIQWQLASNPGHLTRCAWVTKDSCKYNLIWGVEYKDIDDLISGFDMRVCAMAINMATEEMHMVSGAIQDAYTKRIVWQPSAKALSVHRLFKYAKKGFEIDKYQRLMFVDLIQGGKYNVDLELNTGYGENK